MGINIEVGKYYKSETGKRVGPMAVWRENVEHPFEQKGGSNTFDQFGDMWRVDGTSAYHCPSLVSEWPEEIADALEAR